MGVKLSVIVPVYNVERYLAKCLDSIIFQDLSPDNYQIIIVDDGSTDSSGRIADEYNSNYRNVVVIHQPNGGLSRARNAGLDVAAGEYVQFVDSDDYLEPDVLGALVRKMDSDNLDVLRFNYQNVNEKYEVFCPYKEMKPYVDFRDEVCDGLYFLNERLGYACYVVQFIIRKQMLISNSLFFKPDILFEDTEWTPRMLVCAERVSSVDTVAYNYLFRQNSITNAISVEKVEKGLMDKLSLITSLKNQAGLVADNRWHYGMISSSVLSILSTVSVSCYAHRKRYFKALKDCDIFPLSEYHISAGKIKKVRLINVSPRIYCLVQHLKSKI